MAALGWLSYEFGITHQECASVKAYIPLMQLKLQEDFLKYFDQSGQLQKLQNMGHKYEKLLTKWQKRKEYGKPFRFPVDIDIKSLLELSGPQFFRLLLHEPLRATTVIHRVVHTSLASLLSMPDLQLEQVQVIIRLQSISSLPVYHPHVSGVGGIMLLNGILIAMTTPIKYSRSAVFHCTVSDCPNHKGQRVSENLPYRPFRCSLCGGDVKEVPQAHDLGEQVVGMFINPTAIDNSQPHTYDSHQAITICFQDDLISGLQLGAQYNVAGHQSNKFFYAWSVQPWCPVGLGNSHLPLSTNIAKLHAWINEISVNSPWAFVTAICSYLAADLYPTSAFFPLKYGLILSIASQASNIPIAILAVGEDTSVASRLMNRACYLAHRHQTFSCPAVSGPIGGLARWDEKGYRWFEAGPLILAAPGVCYLGDWSKFKQRNLQSTILSALESGQVSFDTQGTGPVGPTLSAPTFPLRCAVWTYWSWTSHSRKQADQAHFHTLVNVFGIPFVVDDKNETENVASQILAQAMSGLDEKEPIITSSELREYLTMVAAQPVTFSKEASQLIRGYFVASRRVRPNCLPVGAVSTIAALSEAHARLARRDTVLYADVVAVLYLYETAILKLFGQCYVSPPPFNSSYQSELPLPIQMHNRLEDFSSWIDNYVRSLAGSNFSHFNNEE